MACIAKFIVMNQTTGVSPMREAPMAIPVKPDYVMGVSQRRWGPCLSMSPLVILQAPWQQATSSPMMKTLGSLVSSSSRARFKASLLVIFWEKRLRREVDKLLSMVSNYDFKIPIYLTIYRTLPDKPSGSFVGRVGDQLFPRPHWPFSTDVQITHRTCQALLQHPLFNVKQPHHYSPNQPRQCHETVFLRPFSPLPLFLFLRKMPSVEHLSQGDGYPTEEIEIDLVVNWSLFAEDDASDQETGYKAVERSGSQELGQKKAGEFVKEDEHSQFFTVFPGVPEYRLDCFGVEAFEKKYHDERVNESYPASILKPIPQSLQQRQHLSHAQNHFILTLILKSRRLCIQCQVPQIT